LRRFGGLTVRLLSLPLLLSLPIAFVSGCVHRTAVQDFGLPASQSKVSPDRSIRAVFKSQAAGAFNARTDDTRIRALESRLKVSAEDISARLELAAAFEGYRLYDDALAHYTEALRLSTAATGAGGTRAQISMFGIVRCQQALGRAWQAIPLLEQFLRDAPSAAAWNALALLRDASGEFAAAEEAYRQAVSFDPSSDLFHNNLGYNLMLQNKSGDAGVEFRRALELNPKSAITHNNFGMLLARSGELHSAFEQFQFAADAATAHNNLAVVLMEIGKYEQSRDELTKALAVRRNFGPALANFKVVQERIRQREELAKAARPVKNGVPVALAEQEATPQKYDEEKQ